MNNEYQMDLFSLIERLDKTKNIKYDFHHQLIELGFHCNRVGKSYEKRIFYKNYFIDFLFKSDYPNCYFAHISYSREMFEHAFSHMSFITNDEIGKRIFFDDEILTYPTYLLNFEDLFKQFVMRYENIASDKDKFYKDELYRIRDEDYLRKW